MSTKTLTPTLTGAIRLMPRELICLVRQTVDAYPGREADAWAAATLVFEGFAVPDPAGTAVTVAGDGPSRIVTFAGRAWSCPCRHRGAGPCIHELAASLAVDEVPAGLVTRPGAENGSAVAARAPLGI